MARERGGKLLGSAVMVGPNAAGIALLICRDAAEVRLASQLQVASQLFITAREQHPSLRALLPVSGLVYEHLCDNGGDAARLRLQ